MIPYDHLDTRLQALLGDLSKWDHVEWSRDPKPHDGQYAGDETRTECFDIRKAVAVGSRRVMKATDLTWGNLLDETVLKHALLLDLDRGAAIDWGNNIVRFNMPTVEAGMAVGSSLAHFGLLCSADHWRVEHGVGVTPRPVYLFAQFAGQAFVLDSTTAGHAHLYVDCHLEHQRWFDLFAVLRNVEDFIEPGYLDASIRRGQSFLRTPWTAKDPVSGSL